MTESTVTAHPARHAGSHPRSHPEGRAAADPTLPGTVALTLLTLSVAVGFGRLFQGTAWFVPLATVAVATHWTAWWARRRTLPTVAGLAATLAVTAVLASWFVLGQHTSYGVPTLETLRAAGLALQDARGTFSDAVPPVEVLPGFMLAALLGTGVAAFMADWAAFRIQTTFESLVPSFTLFVFTSALARDRYRTVALVAFVAAVLAFMVAHQMSRHQRAGSWFGGRPSGAPRALGGTAAALGAVAVITALVVGPALPGAGSDAVVSYRGGGTGGPSSRATVSPLVDIRGRLVERVGIEVFTVEAGAPAYWRLTSLDEFDGQIWRSEDNYRDVSRQLPADVPVDGDVPAQTLEQHYAITNLASIWVPAAYRPVRVSGLADAGWAAASASLITPEETSDGLTYTVESVLPAPDAAALRTAEAVAPGDVAERYLALPPVPGRVLDLARALTAGAATPYDRALALQDFFRTRFEYDLSFDQGHGSDAMERFLFDTRRGYCEQFAGTYAVLARAVGLPTRVAVGFTWGQLADDGRYHVRDEHAHAWPEVYLHGFGWVPFEPTPTRGIPGAEQWTGVTPAQDESTAGGVLPETVPPTTMPVPDVPDTSVPDPFADQDQTIGTDDPQRSLWANPTVRVLLVLTAGALLWGGGVPLLYELRRRRRRAEARTAGAAVLAAWAEVHEALAAAGISRRPSETYREFADRAVHSAGLQDDHGRGLRTLAATAARAAYGASELDAEDARWAAATAQSLVAVVRGQLTRGQRVRSLLDPRPLATAGR